MNLQQRLFEIENELDTLDFNDPKFKSLSDEADMIADEINAVKDAAELRYKQATEKNRLKVAQDKVMSRIENNSRFNSFYEWFQWAKSLYPIQDNGDHLVVTSNARKWSDGTDMSWIVYSEVEAIEKIDELITYKINDRNRGRGSMDKDMLQMISRVV
jgi:uncharacterized protein YdcH (DUF465 family)